MYAIREIISRVECHSFKEEGIEGEWFFFRDFWEDSAKFLRIGATVIRYLHPSEEYGDILLFDFRDNLVYILLEVRKRELSETVIPSDGEYGKIIRVIPEGEIESVQESLRGIPADSAIHDRARVSVFSKHRFEFGGKSIFWVEIIPCGDAIPDSDYMTKRRITDGLFLGLRKGRSFIWLSKRTGK